MNSWYCTLILRGIHVGKFFEVNSALRIGRYYRLEASSVQFRQSEDSMFHPWCFFWISVLKTGIMDIWLSVLKIASYNMIVFWSKGFFAGIIYNSMKAIKKVAVTHAGDLYNFSKLWGTTVFNFNFFLSVYIQNTLLHIQDGYLEGSFINSEWNCNKYQNSVYRTL